jgi:hypothetical protein
MQLLTLSLCVLVASTSAQFSSNNLQKGSISRSILGETCYIRNILAHPNDYLELTSGLSKAVTSYKKGGVAEIDKSGQWKVEK